MKAIATIIFIIFIGFSAQAQQEITATGLLNDTELVNGQKEQKVARLYKFKNSRIKKELFFRTKKNRAKLA